MRVMERSRQRWGGYEVRKKALEETSSHKESRAPT